MYYKEKTGNNEQRETKLAHKQTKLAHKQTKLGFSGFCTLKIALSLFLNERYTRWQTMKFICLFK